MNRPPITRDFAERVAEEWIVAWNAHDVPRVLSHYEDDFEMASPLIIEIAGEPSGVLRGKERRRLLGGGAPAVARPFLREARRLHRRR